MLDLTAGKLSPSVSAASAQPRSGSGGAPLGDQALRRAQRVRAHEHTALRVIGERPGQLGDLVGDRRMAEHRQAKGRLGDEDVARRDLKGRAGRVGDALVVAGHHHPLAGVLEQDLGRSEHVPGGNESRVDPAGQADSLAVFDRYRPFARLVAQLHDRQRRGRGDGLAMPAARMVGMAVRHQRPFDRAAGIDPAVRRSEVNAVRLGADPREAGAHAVKIGARTFRSVSAPSSAGRCRGSIRSSSAGPLRAGSRGASRAAPRPW